MAQATKKKIEFDPLTFEPIRHGPTWKTDDSGNWLLPEHTLGWEIAGWCAEWLTNEEGKPWVFTLEQLRFVLWFYAVDERGRFVYRNATLVRMKGWGKDPLAAILCLVELIGPCRFSHWEDGSPVATDNPAAWVQMASVSYEQNKNTMMLIPQFLPDRTRLAHGIGSKDVGREKVFAFNGRRRLEMITSASRSSEGNRPSFFLANETHHWTPSNGGVDMYDVVERNATKSKGGATRILEITNAFLPGEQSVAERSWQSYWKTITINPETGKPYSIATGILYDSLEAPPEAPLDPDVAPYVLEKVRGDAIWLDIEAIVRSIVDPRNPPSRSRRFWYNQRVAADEALYGPDVLAEIRTASPLAPGDEIVLGFDGGRTDDSTALVAIRLADRSIHPIAIWEKPPGPTQGPWEIDRGSVDDTVAFTFTRYKVRAFFADVSQWESYIEVWSDRYREKLVIKAVAGKSTVGFDMRGHQEEITRMNEMLYGSIHEGSVSFDPKNTYQDQLESHFLNTQGRVNQYGMSFEKIGGPESSRKNDAYAATLLAYIALNRYLESGKRPKERTGKFWMF